MRIDGDERKTIVEKWGDEETISKSIYDENCIATKEKCKKRSKIKWLKWYAHLKFYFGKYQQHRMQCENKW